MISSYTKYTDIIILYNDNVLSYIGAKELEKFLSFTLQSPSKISVSPIISSCPDAQNYGEFIATKLYDELKLKQVKTIKHLYLIPYKNVVNTKSVGVTELVHKSNRTANQEEIDLISKNNTYTDLFDIKYIDSEVQNTYLPLIDSELYSSENIKNKDFLNYYKRLFPDLRLQTIPEILEQSMNN